MLLTTTVTELGQEPVTVDEVKVSARIDADITELDGQIATLIKSTRLVAEHECERLFLPCTMRLGYDDWPTDIWPLQLVTELVKVETLDLAIGWVEVPDWTLERDANGTTRIVYGGGTLPPLLKVPGVRVRVTVNVGCPENVRAYIIAMACHQLTNGAASGKPSNPPAYLSGLLDRERRWP